MSPHWDAKKALKKIRERPEHEVADVLMDQNTFAGLGYIMKNEILFLLWIHPETKIKNLGAKLQRDLVRTSEDYAWQFFVGLLNHCGEFPTLKL